MDTSIALGSYKRVLDNLHDGLYITDKNRVITYWNDAAEKISGFSAKEVVGKSCASNILTHVDEAGDNVCCGICPLAETMSDGEMRENSLYLHHKDGHRVPVSIRSTPLTNEDGEIIGGIELFTDATNHEANKLRLKELEKLALMDGLTKLPNRNYIDREIDKHLAEYERHKVPFGIMFIDIDHFKDFNDTYGHDAGDEVLKYVAKTFISNSRPFDLYGRWGGEEFLVIIPNVTCDILSTIAERVRTLVATSYVVKDDKKLAVTISIGATMAKTGDSLDCIVKRADSLLYKSKDSGRNCISIDSNN